MFCLKISCSWLCFVYVRTYISALSVYDIRRVSFQKFIHRSIYNDTLRPSCSLKPWWLNLNQIYKERERKNRRHFLFKWRTMIPKHWTNGRDLNEIEWKQQTLLVNVYLIDSFISISCIHASNVCLYLVVKLRN